MYTEVNRGMQRHIPLYTSVYLCPRQGYTEVYRGMGRGTQRYAEVSRCMQRYARSCIEKYPSAHRHIQMNTDTLVFTLSHMYVSVFRRCVWLNVFVFSLMSQHLSNNLWPMYASWRFPSSKSKILIKPSHLDMVEAEAQPLTQIVPAKESHFSRWSEQFLSFVWRWSARFAVELLVLVSFVWRWSAHFLIELLCWLKIHWFQACFNTKNNKTSIIKKLVNQW